MTRITDTGLAGHGALGPFSAHYGYGENRLTVGPAQLAADGNRVEYRRTWPPITEWYVNKAAGLEQGFTIASPPGAKAASGPLQLVLESTGDLRASPRWGRCSSH